MLDRAQWLKPIEGAILDHSAAHPALATELALQFPDREVCHLRPNLPVGSDGNLVTGDSFAQKLAKLMKPWLGSAGKMLPTPHYRVVPVVASAVPQDAESLGMVWSNMLLHRLESPPAVFDAWGKSLKAGGALFFSCLGPDSGLEIRRALAALGYEDWDYADMHDLGDALMHAGFSDPVMEMEKLTLTYDSSQSLLREWRLMESGRPLARQGGKDNPGLKTQGFFDALCAQLDKQRQPHSNRLHLTLEVIYGHAWRVNRPARTKESRVSLEDIGGRKHASQNKNT